MKRERKLEQVGRLALREVGEFWIAYYADNDTMDGALVLGTLHMSIAAIPARKRDFMQLMQEAVADMVQQTLGVRPVWPEPPQAAPAHEGWRA